MLLLYQTTAFSLKRLRPAPATAPKDSRVFLFDLDGTLYPPEAGRNSNHNDILVEFIIKQKGISRPEAETLLTVIRNEYHNVPELGVTKKLQVQWKVVEDWIQERLNLYGFLKPDIKLKHLLARMKIPKYVFTNSGLYEIGTSGLLNFFRIHAMRVLSHLDLLDSFDGIIYSDYNLDKYHIKPHPEAYTQAMKLIGQDDPAKIFFVDDKEVYAIAASEAGWNVLHKSDIEKADRTEFGSVISLMDLRRKFPDLFHPRKVDVTAFKTIP